MKINNYQLIQKKIDNKTHEEKFIKDVVVLEIEDIKKFNLKSNDIKVFRSARHKNDMPTFFKLGSIDDSLNDALTKISENGSSLVKDKCNLIISDHLTIIGNSNDAFVISFLGGNKHLIRVEIRLDDYGNFLSLKIIAEINKILKPKEEFILEKIEIYNTDNVSEAIKDFANKKLIGKDYKKKKCPAVYCTWYYYGQTISFKDCLTNLNIISKKELPLDVFQIDDGWEDKIGDWNPNKKFNYDMKIVASQINNHHLIPGLWTSPFILEKRSKLAKLHPEWILKNSKNKPCIFRMNKNKFYIIDITIKETWKHFEELYRKLTNEYGFKYHKLDFTRAAIIADDANYKNKYITIVEAYRNACLSIRKGMGDSYFLMCGGLYDPLIGIVDAQRTGSDVLSMWSAANRGGKTLPFTMKQSLLRYYMNAWWHNDPDAFVIRRNNKKYKRQKVSLGLLNDNEVKTSTINQIISGGLFSMTEPLDKIDNDRLNNLNHILPLKKVNIELVDIMNTPRYPNLIRIECDNNHYLAIINYDDNNTLVKEIDCETIIGKKVDINNKFTISLPPHASTILKITGEKIKEVDNKKHYLS